MGAGLGFYPYDDIEEVMRCRVRGTPDPHCEGCRGTGTLPIRNRAGERVPCHCWAWCDNHDRYCGTDE